ncbi:MAG: SUF system NifU family Fe-S cluster assembly protein [Selenomonas sp.]|nr:SUF system NifU family Fe-S cluster assembly protein [Selenomonas sp.]
MPTENTALGDLYTEVIGEHSRSPENKGELAAATVRERGHNPSCGDEITLELQIENGIIKDAAFTGVGCAISQASTDIMIDLMRGKTVEEAQRLVQLFTSMIKREVTDDAALEELDEAIALKNISNMPARVKCAVLAWHTLEDVLKKDK